MSVPISCEYNLGMVVVPLKHLAQLPHQNTLNGIGIRSCISADNKAEPRSLLAELLHC